MPAHQPNILLFMPDAVNAGAIEAASQCIVPNIDRLAARGLRIRGAHSVAPVCSPSRASLMTGVLPHNHGVLQVEHCTDDDQSRLRTRLPHWAQRLTQAGYRTGYFGKWHIERSNRLEDFGWQVNGCDEAAAYRDIGVGVEDAETLLDGDSFARYIEGPEGYNPVLHYGVTQAPTGERRFARSTDLACDFIRRAGGPGAAPWACCVSFSEPNTPVIAGREAFERYDIDAIELPANLRDELAGRPALYRRAQRVQADTSERQWRELRAVYFALLTEIDAQLGRLMDTLEEQGILDDTLVIVTADHGRYVGEHGFDNHNFGAFEGPYRIPMILAGPGVAKGQATDAYVSLMDLCPTLIEAAGAPPMENLDGRSFLPLLGDPQGRAPDFNACYAESHGTRFELTQRVYWEGPWKFVFNGFDEDELYNLADDPDELENLASRPDRAERVRYMMARVWERIRQSDDKAMLGTHYLPMRFAAVGPNVRVEPPGLGA